MDALELARWQFGITTVYHFLFVPITIGLSGVVAGMQTAWFRTSKEKYLRLTKFFGKLFLINFALGVVTGIVQEFQFGMNWSDYSRFVGDIFGAPLAVEGLLAFFLESTFLGLWIFGWDKLPRKLHLATIWLAHIGTVLSAYFILAANSWMQHPVGYEYNATTGRAELHDFFAVLFNKVQLVTFPHTVISAYFTAGAFVLGIAAWHFARKSTAEHDKETYLSGIRIGAAVTLIAGLGIAVSGDIQGKIMTEVQPMKMAAAEALYTTSDSCAPFSVFTIGTPDGKTEKFAIKIPCLLSFLATGNTNGTVQGINDISAQYQAQYGSDPTSKAYAAGDYTPIIPITYWTFRWMIGVGALAALFGLLILLRTRRGRAPTGRAWVWMALSLPFLPVAANSFGWMFTEMGRQPWVVFGLMTTANGVSPGVSAGEVWISVISYTLIYLILAIVEIGLIVKYAKAGAEPYVEPPDPSLREPSDEPLTFAY